MDLAVSIKLKTAALASAPLVEVENSQSKGATASAIVYTMVEMAKANDLNIYKYLTYLLSQRPNDKMSDEQLEQLADQAVGVLCVGSGQLLQHFKHQNDHVTITTLSVPVIAFFLASMAMLFLLQVLPSVLTFSV